MDYNKSYKTTVNVFGKDPERILVEFCRQIPKTYPILDIGAGQGRNTIYLSGLGYDVDAIDTSPVSIQLLEEIKEKENLNILTSLADFKDFTGKNDYSAILVFGLLQILDWEEIELLKGKISKWLINGGLLFVTAFTTLDNSFKLISVDSKKIGRNSYLQPEGEKRTFFEPGEIKHLFNRYKILHYWEGLGPEHRHGDSPVQRHAMVEAVFQK